MDAADSAQIEIEREHERSIAALKKPLVESTAECIECGAEIPPERQQAVNTNLCIGVLSCLKSSVSSLGGKYEKKVIGADTYPLVLLNFRSSSRTALYGR